MLRDGRASLSMIDAHQHFWDTTRLDYPGMTGALAKLRRAYTPLDLQPHLAETGVVGTIVVETRSDLNETRELMATAPELTRNHMEVRGIGIINVAHIFGIGSIRMEKRLDLVVTLQEWDEIDSVDRIGLDREFYEILGLQVPHVTIPVKPGRDIARLIEVAAMDQKLKALGQNSAVEFNTKLLNLMVPEPKQE